MSGTSLVSRKRPVAYEEDAEITQPHTSKRFRTYHANSPIHSSPTTILAEPNPNLNNNVTQSNQLVHTNQVGDCNLI